MASSDKDRNSDLLSMIRSEIEERLADLRPVLAEHEQLLAAMQALDAGGPSVPAHKPARRARLRRASRGAARESILAALEHGSHTVGELVTVTAMSAANIGGNVRRLLGEGAISKTQRDGKAAYVLAAGSER